MALMTLTPSLVEKSLQKTKQHGTAAMDTVVSGKTFLMVNVTIQGIYPLN